MYHQTEIDIFELDDTTDYSFDYSLDYQPFIFSDGIWSNEFFYVRDCNCAKNIHENYVRAITKHSDYFCDLESHILRGAGIVWFQNPTSEGVLVGFFIENIFIVSHFAPNGMKSGVKMLKHASKHRFPFVLAVPDFLAKQLERLDFRCIGQVPQTFAGKTIIKNVMVNQAFTMKHQEMLFEHFLKKGY